MITITIIGLEDYTVGHYAKEHTEAIANLYETSEDQILFVNQASLVFHKGIEQTSWSCIIRVNAPKACEALEAQVAKYLLGTISQFSVHVTLEFYYFENKNSYEHINKEYPRFIDESNMVEFADQDYNENEEICDENMFQNFEEKYQESHEHDDECCCNGDSCCCGHHHHKD